jgi:translation initiation factor 3 subunit L
MDYDEGERARAVSTDADRESEAGDGIPDVVIDFVRQLGDYVKKGDMDQVYQLYDQQFNNLTERFFKSQRWPSVKQLKEQRDDCITEEFHETLYKEMYYRHLYSRLVQQVTLEDRKESWDNYVALLEAVLKSMGSKAEKELPMQWVWDILDEFIYQYQTFTSFRNKAVKANADASGDVKSPIEFIKENPDMWATGKVYRILHSLVESSKVRAYLALAEEQRVAASKEQSSLPLRPSSTLFFGYFAIIGLLRVECLFGDYFMALRMVEGLDFGPVALYHKVPACHTTVFYYTGFSYLMMRRYEDAVRTFNSVLQHLSRTRLAPSLSYQQEQIMKKAEQMNALLMIAVALSPQRVDDSMLQNIKDKHYEKQQKLQKGDQTTFEELFNYTCPKFISPAPPDWNAIETFNPNEAHQRQLNLFLTEVQQQAKFPEIRAYMRLYSAMPVPKLSQFLDLDADTLRTLLMCYKYKTRQVQQAGPLFDGMSVSQPDVSFTLDGSMMHMVAQKPQKQYTNIFLQQIVKFQDIIRSIEGKPPPS